MIAELVGEFDADGAKEWPRVLLGIKKVPDKVISSTMYFKNFNRRKKLLLGRILPGKGSSIRGAIRHAVGEILGRKRPQLILQW